MTLADTIWLEAGGTGVEVAVERSFDKGGTTDAVVRRDERAFSYGLTRDRIEVSFVCNDVVIRSCAAPPHYRGSVTRSRLVFEHALYLRSPLEYERVLR